MLRLQLIFHALCYLGLLSARAQTPATETEKQQIRQLLQTYEKDLQIIARFGAQPSEQNQGKRELLTIVEDKSIWVVNDLDSLPAAKPVSLHQYIQEELPTRFPNGLHIALAMEKAQFSPVKHEKVRRFDYLEVRVPKSLTWQMAVTADSSTDTLEFNRTITLSFFVRFNRNNSLEKFRLVAISKAGTAPILPPLPPLVAWWAELSPDWKAVLMKNCKMEEYPYERDIENLLAIRKLSIAKTPIRDASPLAEFTQLVELDCSQTAIEDLSPLSELTALEDLNVSRTRIRSLSGIDSLFNLVRLNGSFLKLKDIKPVALLTKLEDLNVGDNEITDLSPVAGLAQLRKLNFNNNQVTTLTPLSALMDLEELRFMKNKVDNFQLLSQFPNLVVLDCYSTGLDNLEPLKSLPKLVNLNCGANPISTLEPIANHSFLVELNISITKINSLTLLKKFNQLEVLDFSNTMVPELGPVHDIPGLRVLRCQLTKVEVRDKDRFKKKHPGCEITYF